MSVLPQHIGKWLKRTSSADSLKGSTIAPSTIGDSTLRPSDTAAESQLSNAKALGDGTSLVLTLSSSNVLTTTFYTSTGAVAYNVSKSNGNTGTSNAYIRTTVTDGEGNFKGHWDNPVMSGSEMIKIGSKEMKRSSWLTGALLLGFGDTKGRFSYNGVKYKWQGSEFKLAKAGQEVHVFTLYGPAKNTPLARFTAAYRDWSAPTSDVELIIIPGRLEIFEEALEIPGDFRFQIVLSLILTEKQWCDDNPLAISYDNAAGRSSTFAQLL